MTAKQPNAPQSDHPTLLSGAENGIKPDSVSRAALTVLQTLQQAGFESYLVGGGVRDILVGLRPKDFDIATAAEPQQIRSLFRRSRMIGRRFVLVHVRVGREVIEVATFRAAPIIDTPSCNVNESGRIVRDNQYTATLAEDAKRRDFTINSLYYDPSSDTIVDFNSGVADLTKRTVRIIGDPDLRYQEDPVRILRALRFAAKLGFDIAHETAVPIHQYGAKLQGVPAARLYEEVLKLLMTGCAERSYQLLLEYGLFFCLLSKQQCYSHHEPGGFSDRLTRFALADTDARIAAGKANTPAFLFAALLWVPVWHGAATGIARGLPRQQAYDTACVENLERLSGPLSLPRRIAAITREIWLMQPRLEHCKGGAQTKRLMSHPRFRAAYDFLLLRVKAGAPLQKTATRWTHCQQPSEDSRQATHQKPPRKRRTRRHSASVNSPTAPLDPSLDVF